MLKNSQIGFIVLNVMLPGGRRRLDDLSATAFSIQTLKLGDTAAIVLPWI
jgi:hypothetical protein